MNYCQEIKSVDGEEKGSKKGEDARTEERKKRFLSVRVWLEYKRYKNQTDTEVKSHFQSETFSLDHTVNS